MFEQMEDYKDEAIKMVQNDWKKHQGYAIGTQELTLTISYRGKELVVGNVHNSAIWTIMAETHNDYDTFLYMRSYWSEPEETKQEVEYKGYYQY